MKPILYTAAGFDENSLYEVYVQTAAGVPEKLFCADAIVENFFGDYTSGGKYKVGFCRLDYDFHTPLKFIVITKRKFHKACVRPEAKNISHTYANNVMTFEMTEPSQISVEFDGNIYENLFIFASLPEDNVPDKNDKNVIWLGEGVHDLRHITLTEGQTLYIDGNATYYGRLTANGDNIRVTGRGIICGEHFDHEKEKYALIECTGNNITLENFTIIDAPGWTIVPVHCTNFTVRDTKQISYNGNSDGFDICSCQHVLIEDCFMRNSDDCISLKTHRGGDNIGIVMRKCVLWCDRAHLMLIGPESKGYAYRDILFEDIDVLEHRESNTEFMGVMAIFCADDAEMSDITWRDIRVERMTRGRLFSFDFVEYYAKSIGKSLRNVLVENVRCDMPGSYHCRLRGADEDHTIDGVTFRNVVICGTPLVEGSKYIEPGDFRYNIKFE